MFVADVFNEQDILLYSARTLITSDHQIEFLRNQGVSSVFVLSDEPSFDHAEAPGEEGVGDHFDRESPSGESVLAYAHYQQRLKAASVLHEQTLTTVRESMKAVRMGKLFQSQAVVKSTEQMIEQVVLDPDLYFGLMQIRSLHDHVYIHSVNVAIMTAAFASTLNFSSDLVRSIAIGAMLHDIGKMRLPEALCLKNGSCTRKEFELFKQHPAFGIDIIDGNKQKLPEAARAIIAQHHERWNGGGYPKNLSGDLISESALMCALADVYDMLTTPTPYRSATIPQEALAIIFQRADDEYPRPLMEQFARLIGIYPVGSFVELKSGEKGLVIRINRSSLLTPVVVILVDRNEKLLTRPFVRDLSKGPLHPSDHMHYAIDGSRDPFKFGIFPSRYFKAFTL